MTKKDYAASGKTKGLPPLYKNLVPLDPDVHKNLNIMPKQKFDFAAKANVVPVVINEMASVAKYYPIVFAGDGSVVMLAVLGLEKDENLFVDDEGNWIEDTYIPAYVRRYPFYIAKSDNVDGPIMCFDEGADCLNQEGGTVLIEDGKVTDDMKEVAEFSNMIQNFLEATHLYGKGLEEAGILESQTVALKLREEVKAQIDGFKTVNQEKFEAVDSQTLKNWRDKDWLDATVLHLASGENFNRLWQMKLKKDKVK